MLYPLRRDRFKSWLLATYSHRLLGLAVGQQWSDYRLPASPEQFIGRREISQEILRMIDTDADVRVIQVRSRSGVGKSSLLAFVAESLRRKGHRVEIHDARDVKSVFDLFSVIQRFCDEARPPSDLRAAEMQLRRLAEKTADRRAVFMVDQFESVFVYPELFGAYEALALSTARATNRLAFIFARKSDQLTTFDDTRISLERLNQHSRPYVLQDFTVEEAAELIQRISETAAKKISNDVRAFVLEFAQGFPWLIKRTMAHILRLVSEGVVQKELFAAGLRLDELFDEELEGLDEVERDYLTRLAPRLPANIQQLQQQFDEDPMLKRVLDRLTQSRLLRLAGSTYDTYNDVFKEYIVYQRLPEFRQIHMHRLWPRTVLRRFHKLIEQSRWTVDEMREALGLSRGSLFNLIRELRALGLLRKDGSHWRIPPIVQDICNRGALGDYVRRAALENAVIADLLSLIAREGHIRLDGLPHYLERQFVFVDAAPRTWQSYARILVAWMTALRLVSVDQDRLVLSGQKRADVIQELGNLTSISGVAWGTRRRDVFLPQTQWTQIVRIVTRLMAGEQSRGVSAEKAMGDLRGLGVIAGERLHVQTMTDLRKAAKSILSGDAYAPFWSAAKKGTSLLAEMEKLTQGSSDVTIRWRTKILLNWGKELGIIPKRRYRYS